MRHVIVVQTLRYITGVDVSNVTCLNGSDFRVHYSFDVSNVTCLNGSDLKYILAVWSYI